MLDDLAVQSDLLSGDAHKQLGALTRLLQRLGNGIEVSYWADKVMVCLDSESRFVRSLAAQVLRAGELEDEQTDKLCTIIQQNLGSDDGDQRVVALRMLSGLPDRALVPFLREHKTSIDQCLSSSEAPVRKATAALVPRILLRSRSAVAVQSTIHDTWRQFFELLFDADVPVATTAMASVRFLLTEQDAGPTEILDVDDPAEYRRSAANILAPLMELLEPQVERLQQRVSFLPITHRWVGILPVARVFLRTVTGDSALRKVMILDFGESFLLPMLGALDESLIYEAGSALLSVIDAHRDLCPEAWGAKIVLSLQSLLARSPSKAVAELTCRAVQVTRRGAPTEVVVSVIGELSRFRNWRGRPKMLFTLVDGFFATGDKVPDQLSSLMSLCRESEAVFRQELLYAVCQVVWRRTHSGPPPIRLAVAVLEPLRFCLDWPLAPGVLVYLRLVRFVAARRAGHEDVDALLASLAQGPQPSTTGVAARLAYVLCECGHAPLELLKALVAADDEAASVIATLAAQQLAAREPEHRGELAALLRKNKQIWAQTAASAIGRMDEVGVADALLRHVQGAELDGVLADTMLLGSGASSEAAAGSNRTPQWQVLSSSSDPCVVHGAHVSENGALVLLLRVLNVTDHDIANVRIFVSHGSDEIRLGNGKVAWTFPNLESKIPVTVTIPVAVQAFCSPVVHVTLVLDQEGGLVGAGAGAGADGDGDDFEMVGGEDAHDFGQDEEDVFDGDPAAVFTCLPYHLGQWSLLHPLETSAFLTVWASLPAVYNVPPMRLPASLSTDKLVAALDAKPLSRGMVVVGEQGQSIHAGYLGESIFHDRLGISLAASRSGGGKGAEWVLHAQVRASTQDVLAVVAQDPVVWMSDLVGAVCRRK